MDVSRTIQNPKGWCHQDVAFNMSANLEGLAVAKVLEKVNPHPNSQEETKGCASHWTIAPSRMLVRSFLKSCILGFSIMQTKKFQMSKLGLEKEEGPEIKLPVFTGS